MDTNLNRVFNRLDESMSYSERLLASLGNYTDPFLENERLRSILTKHGAEVPTPLGRGNLLNEQDLLDQNEALEKQAAALGLSVAKTGNAPAAAADLNESIEALTARLHSSIANLEKSQAEVRASHNETRARLGLAPLPKASATTPKESAGGKPLSTTQRALKAIAEQKERDAAAERERSLAKPIKASFDPNSRTGQALKSKGIALDTDIGSVITNAHKRPTK